MSEPAISVLAAPVPLQIRTGRSEVNGAMMVVLVIDSPTGQAVYFIPATQAKDIGNQLNELSEMPMPLTLPPTNGLILPSNGFGHV